MPAIIVQHPLAADLAFCCLLFALIMFDLRREGR